MRFSWQLKDLHGAHTRLPQKYAMKIARNWAELLVGPNFPERRSLKRFQPPAGPGKCQSFANLWLLTIFIIGIINNTIMSAGPGALSLFAVCPSAPQPLSPSIIAGHAPCRCHEKSSITSMF